MFDFPCKESQEVMYQKKKKERKKVYCCIQMTELVLGECPLYVFLLFPDSCLELSQPWHMAVEEFCHHSQIKDYSAGALYFLFCGYSALLRQSLMLIAKKMTHWVWTRVPSARAAPTYGRTSLGQHLLRDLCTVQSCLSYDPVLILSKQH